MENVPGVTVPISSLVLNSLNFLLFDLLLAAAVYYVTADLAGLANSLSAVQGKYEQVSFYCPTFVGVGVGITCTRRRIFYILAFCRIVSVSLIFISSMSFVGKTISVPAETEAKVTVLGRLQRHDDLLTIGPRLFEREGCQGLGKSTMYYGEIREIRGKKFCELNTSLISTPIEFDFFSHPETLNLSACIREELEESEYKCTAPVTQLISCRFRNQSSNRSGDCVLKKSPFPVCKARDANRTAFSCETEKALLQDCNEEFLHQYLNFRCKNAILGCRLSVKTRPCKATVNLRSETYLCEGNGTRDTGVLPVVTNESRQGGSQDFNNLPFLCKKAKGAEWKLDSWLPHMGGDVLSLEQAYAVMYGSGSERRVVKILKRKKFTTVSWVWFGILCFKLAMIAFLTAAVLLLRNGKGCRRVANDEVGLGSLLVSSRAHWHHHSACEELEDSQTSSAGLYVEMEDNNVRLHAESPEERAV